MSNVTAKTTLRDLTDAGKAVAVYTARGVDYVLELFDDEMGSVGVSVTAWNRNDDMIWDGCTDADLTDRVVDVVRYARANRNA